MIHLVNLLNDECLCFIVENHLAKLLPFGVLIFSDSSPLRHSLDLVLLNPLRQQLQLLPLLQLHLSLLLDCSILVSLWFESSAIATLFNQELHLTLRVDESDFFLLLTFCPLEAAK